MNNKINDIKRVYIETGRLNQNVVSKDIAISWYKCRLQNMHPTDRIKNANCKSVKHFDVQFENFIDAIVSQKYQYLLTNMSLQVSTKRLVDPNLESIDSIDDLLIGTNAGYNALKSSNVETVSLDEHYLDSLSKYYSVGFPVIKDGKTIGCLMILSESLPSAYDLSYFTSKLSEYMNRGYGIIQNEAALNESEFSLNSILKNLAYPDTELSQHISLIKKGLTSQLPLVISGEVGSGKTYHLRLIGFTFEDYSYIDLKSIPRSLQKSCLENGLSQNRTLLIDDINYACDEFIQLLTVYTDSIINKNNNENSTKIKCSKVILTTVYSYENKYYTSLMERLKFNVIHLKSLNAFLDDYDEVVDKFLNINGVKFDDLVKKHLVENAKNMTFFSFKSLLIDKSVMTEDGFLLKFESLFDNMNALKSIDDNEKLHIENVLKLMDYNILAAAKVLRISRSTLYRKIEKYQIDVCYYGTQSKNTSIT